MLISVYIHRSQRQRASFEPPSTSLHQILLAVSQHGLLKRQLLAGLIGAIHPPPESAHRRFKGVLISPDFNCCLAIFHPLSWPTSVGAQLARRVVLVVAQPQALRHPI